MPTFTQVVMGKQENPGDLSWCYIIVVQSLSPVWLFGTPWTAASQAPLSFTISWSLLKFMSIDLVMLSSYLILCHPILLPSVVLSIRVFPNELACPIRWPGYWNFSIIYLLPLMDLFPTPLKFSAPLPETSIWVNICSRKYLHNSQGFQARGYSTWVKDRE